MHRRSLAYGENPDNPTLRHVLLPPDQVADQCLLACRIDPVAGLNGYILHTANLEGGGWRDDPGVGPELPELLAGPGVVGTEVTVIRASAKDQIAGGCKQRTPHHRTGIELPPRALALVYV